MYERDIYDQLVKVNEQLAELKQKQNTDTNGYVTAYAMVGIASGKAYAYYDNATQAYNDLDLYRGCKIIILTGKVNQ